MADADNADIPAVFVDQFVEVVPATPGKRGLVCAVKTLPKCMRLVEESEPISFKFESSHIGLTYVRETYPWLDIDPVSNQLHAHSIEPELRRWSTVFQELFQHGALRISGVGGYCKNGGCYKCGPHVMTIAALRSVSVDSFVQECMGADRAGGAPWTQMQTVDEQRIIDRMQVFEVVIILDFIKKFLRGREMQSIICGGGLCQQRQKKHIRLFALYVWHTVGIWKTHALVMHFEIKTSASHDKEREIFHRFADEGIKKLQRISAEVGRLYTFEDMHLACQIIAGRDFEKKKFMSCAVLFNKWNFVRYSENITDKPNVRRCQNLRTGGLLSNPEVGDIQHSFEVLRDIEVGDFLVEQGEGNEFAENYRARNAAISLVALAARDAPGFFCYEVAQLWAENRELMPAYMRELLVECDAARYK